MPSVHLPLKTWFTAVHILTSHIDGISALQLQAQLGLGSYKSAWLLLHKLRPAMVDPGRSLLQGAVEIDETRDAVAGARTSPPPAAGAAARSGKMFIRRRRWSSRPRASPPHSPRRHPRLLRRDAQALRRRRAAPGARVVTDGWSGYIGLPDHVH